MNDSAEHISPTPTKANLGGLPYLRIQIDRDTPAVIPMEYAREVLVVPSKRLTPIPNMPDCVLGLLNQRSRVFWIVNLAQILELSSSEKYTQNHHIAIVQVNNIALGLRVNQVKGTVRLESDGIQSPNNKVPSHLIPYVKGCIALKNEILLILELQAIIDSPILHKNNY